MEKKLHKQKFNWLSQLKTGILTLSTLCAGLFAFPVLAQGPPAVWTKQLGGTAFENATSWASTDDGGSIIGGHSTSGITTGKTTPNQGGKDIWIVKLNAAGTTVWEKNFGGTQDDVLKKIIKCSNGDFILAGSSKSGALASNKTDANNGGWDYWVIRISSSGTKIWDETLGGSSDDVLADIVENADGTFIAAGTTLSGATGNKISSSKGFEDYWVTKISSAGVKSSTWDFTFGGGYNSSLKRGYDFLGGVQKTTDGGYILAGHSNGSNANDKSVTFYDDGNNVNQTYSDFWVLKINSSGAKVWDKVYGGYYQEKLYDLKTTYTTDEFLLVGSSRSGNSGNKTNSPVVNDDVADHVWTVRINCSGSTQGTILFSRCYEGQPGVRNYFDNISANTTSAGYYLMLNGRDKDKPLKRIDYYTWAGGKQWSKYLTDTTHFQTNKKLYQVPKGSSFDINGLPYQTKQLYQAFKNQWDADSTSTFLDGLHPRTYPNKINMKAIRGPKTFQNAIKQFLEEGIQDKYLLDVLYDLISDITSTAFETQNLLWPSNRALPGASNSSGKIIDSLASDFGSGNTTFGNESGHSSHKNCALARRKIWLDDTTPPMGAWGAPTTNVAARKSQKYIEWESWDAVNHGKRILYLLDDEDAGSLKFYGTIDPPLEFQLSSEYIFWAGYIMDLNRDLDSRYAAAADALWAYKNDWYSQADVALGGRHSTYKFYQNAQNLYHSLTAHASLFYVLTLWNDLPNRGTDTQDTDNNTAMKYLLKLMLDDYKLYPVPSNAPDAGNYTGGYLANWAHKSNAWYALLGGAGDGTEDGAADMTYFEEFLGMFSSLKRGKAHDISGRTITDSLMRAFSTTAAMIVERGAPGSYPGNTTWYTALNAANGKTNSNPGKVFFNNGNNSSGFDWGKSTEVIDSTVPYNDLLGTTRPCGGLVLGWDFSGRQYKLFEERARLQDVKTAERFNVTTVIADPTNAMKSKRDWLNDFLLLSLKRPEFNLLDPTNPNVPLDISNPDNKGFVFVNNSNQVFALNTKSVSSTNTDYQAVRYGVYSQTLQAEDAALSGGAVTSTLYTGYTGTGYGAYPNTTANQAITWTYIPDFTGTAVMKFRYANGSGADRPLRVDVNGSTVVSTLSFPATTNYTTWDTVSFNQNVTAGTTYTIKLYTATAVKGPNVDVLIPEVLQAPSLQAEQAVIGNGATKASLYNTNATYDAGAQSSSDPRYVAFPNAVTGDFIEWHFYKANSGNVTLSFRYANGDAVNRPMKLEMNGNNVTPAPVFAPSGGWNTWVNQNMTTTLPAGDNVVRLSTTGTKGPNIDVLSFTSSASPNATMSVGDPLLEKIDENLSSGDLNVLAYPNPASEFVRLRISNAKEGKVEISLMSVSGRIERKLSENLSGSSADFTIPLSGLTPGIYFVKVSTVNGTKVSKVVVN